MTDIEDGGPAFPELVSGHSGPARHLDYRDYNFDTIGGMSLRDWFAGQALAAPWAQAISVHEAAATAEGITELATNCYALADAMLKARKPA